MRGRALLVRASVVASAIAATGLALNGCGGGSAINSAVDPVAQAAQISERAPGYRVSISEQITVAGSSHSVTGTAAGVVDQRHHRGALSFHLDVEGDSITTDAQYSDAAVYMRLPFAQKSSVTHGKHWIKFDLHSVAAALGIDSSLSSPGTSSDPRKSLSYLKAVGGRVQTIGNEQVQGAAAVHYRATIDYDRYPSTVPAKQRAAARASIAAIERLTGKHSQAVDVWIDGRHRVRREQLTIQECLPGTAGPTQIHLRTDFLDYGLQTIPAPPPGSDVADVTSYATQKLKQVKVGCS